MRAKARLRLLSDSYAAAIANGRAASDADRVHDALLQRAPGILTYGITPPKLSYTITKRTEVAGRQAARIKALPIDALVVYDLQDESERTSAERPFPFLETVDPIDYAYTDLADVKVPKVCYRCVSRLSRDELGTSLERLRAEGGLCTLVGAASRRQMPRLKLSEAYALHHASYPSVPLGGVMIAERHSPTQREDARVLAKMELGCSFFVSQAVYSVVATKNVLSDLYYQAESLGVLVPPILVTLSPCGSQKTLEFMRWLGISVPRWLANELEHARDILDVSIDLCTAILDDLIQFCRPKGIPLGCNVESVSLRKAEIDASVELVRRAATLLGRAESSAL